MYLPLHKDISVSMEKHQTMPSGYNKDKKKKKKKKYHFQKMNIELVSLVPPAEEHLQMFLDHLVDTWKMYKDTGRLFSFQFTDYVNKRENYPRHLSSKQSA